MAALKTQGEDADVVRCPWRSLVGWASGDEVVLAPEAAAELVMRLLFQPHGRYARVCQLRLRWLLVCSPGFGS